MARTVENTPPVSSGDSRCPDGNRCWYFGPADAFPLVPLELDITDGFSQSPRTNQSEAGIPNLHLWHTMHREFQFDSHVVACTGWNLADTKQWMCQRATIQHGAQTGDFSTPRIRGPWTDGSCDSAPPLVGRSGLHAVRGTKKSLPQHNTYETTSLLRDDELDVESTAPPSELNGGGLEDSTWFAVGNGPEGDECTGWDEEEEEEEQNGSRRP
ncbi:hypothetical protein AXG93_1193s1090 [Marchantia polymorpha subsp. ruderalis]|uniref:Uncharacterized protein n=1 Tax=Marchantia polymorpha subsp. ruderalis TaxID=1480154 RepID=A0A176WNC3_MARPO|nr:hypothetical protein AXG93_1193s1090 [Marchantia polymorpha subsp. ruderalis]